MKCKLAEFFRVTTDFMLGQEMENTLQGGIGMMKLEIGVGVAKEKTDGYQPVVLFLNKDTLKAMEAYWGTEITNRKDMEDAVAGWVQDSLYEIIKVYLDANSHQDIEFSTEVFIVQGE